MGSELLHLSTELQSLILVSLDPISLINVSQTCQKFRGLINPAKRHFIERLLALECIPSYGGPEPHFHARSGEVRSPKNWGYDNEEADGMRWACTHCMRLLDHWNFDNHSLLRLPYRKPPYGSAATLPATSWKPNNGKVSKILQAKIKEEDELRLKNLRTQYDAASNRFDTATPEQRMHVYRRAEIEPFASMISLNQLSRMDPDLEEKYANDAVVFIEEQIGGYKRRLRKCNECRYQLGQLQSQIIPRGGRMFELTGPNLGTKEVPIVKSRQVRIGTRMQRYFPKLFTDLPTYSRKASNAPVFKIYRSPAFDHVFSLYMIRCPDCQCWKEMAAFRIGNMWIRWWPAQKHRWGARSSENWDGKKITEDFVNNLKCSPCYLAAHGEAALTNTLERWFHDVYDVDWSALMRNLPIGWTYIRSMVTKGDDVGYLGSWAPRQKARSQIKSEILSYIPWNTVGGIDSEAIDYAVINDQKLDDLKALHRKLVNAWTSWFSQPFGADGNFAMESRDESLSCWLKGYSNMDAQLRWYRGIHEAMATDSSALLSWALRNIS